MEVRHFGLSLMLFLVLLSIRLGKARTSGLATWTDQPGNAQWQERTGSY
jgi:hypothetical protein